MNLFLSTVSPMPSVKKVLIGVAIGAPLLVIAAPYAIAAAGFGAGGVVGSSAAAAVQSVVYGAWTTGLFSTATSVGAAGLGTAATVGVATAGGATGGYIASKL